jgi:hypothetical protein
VASKSAQEQQVSTETIEEMLDTVDKTLDRLKTLYEQYFLGIQKQAPSHLHTTVERQLRDLAQMQIRNTGMRYRLATLQQKFGAYNAYWKRTVRQIENGTYIRNLSKIGREAIRSGAEIPEEILAAMPKRMREQVVRDREQAIAIAKRRGGEQSEELLTLAPEEPPPVEEVAAMISEPSELRRELKTKSGAYVIDEKDADMDLSEFFASVEQEKKPVVPPTRPTPLPSAMRAAAIGPPPPARKSSPIIPRPAPSQTTRSIPVIPGAAAAKGNVAVESMSGPFPRPPAPGPAVPAPKRPTPDTAAPTIAMPKIPSAPVRVAPPVAKPAAPAPLRPPPGMTDADVNALYAKFVQAKQMVGEAAGPGAREKLLKTINAQAPKIMEQYKAKGVDFSVVVKDNQVIIRAKPKL